MQYPLIVDDKLWNRFKSECAKRGQSMATVLRSLILEYILRGDEENK